MSNPKLALIPSGYKSEKVYSILPNDGSGDFTFDRDTVATRVRKDGLIEEVAADIPRLDWFNSNCPNLLLEPSSANLVPYSEDFSQWTVSSTTVSASTIPAPTGKPTAYKLLATNSDANHQLNSDTFSIVSGAITGSLFVKKGDSRYATLSLQGDYPDRAYLQYDFEQGTINASIDFVDFTILSTKAENYNNGWVRLSFAVSTDAHSSITVLISPKNDVVTTALTDSSDSCFMYVWGIQLEKDTYSTSYIKTEGGSATRNADVCTDAGDADLFDITEGSFYIDITPFINDASSRYISLSDSSSDNRIEYQLRSSANAIDVLCEGQNGGLEVQRTITISFNTRNKLLATFDDSSFKIYVNGSLDFTDTSFTKPTSLNRLSFANNSNNFAYQGKAHDVRVYDRVLTEAEAIKLTT